MKALLISLALVAIASPIIAEPKSHLIGDFACESGTERYSVGIYITVALKSEGKLSLTLMAAHPDGHGAAPDGGGDGRVDASGIFRFTYEDSFFNKGRGTFRRTKRGYLLSIHIDDVQDSRCMPFYGEHLFQRRARKNWPNQAMPFRQAQGPELTQVQRSKKLSESLILVPLKSPNIEMIQIEPFAPRHAEGVGALIVGIQRDEFQIPITLEDQPDLQNIPPFYQKGAGNFWVAVLNNEVVGTVALLDLGNDQAALRKMFVHAAYRGLGHGVSARLLETLLEWSRSRGVKEVYLGTTEKFLAAHRFYERNGFERITATELSENGGRHQILSSRAIIECSRSSANHVF